MSINRCRFLLLSSFHLAIKRYWVLYYLIVARIESIIVGTNEAFCCWILIFFHLLLYNFSFRKAWILILFRSLNKIYCFFGMVWLVALVEEIRCSLFSLRVKHVLSPEWKHELVYAITSISFFLNSWLILH